jgi:hypothetical protein
MQITVLLHIDKDGRECEGVAHSAAPSYANAPHVELEGGQSCPRCGDAPLRAAGFKGRPEEKDGATFAACGCYACGKHVGTIKVELLSIFGEEEDQRVLNGKPRVY